MAGMNWMDLVRLGKRPQHDGFLTVREMAIEKAVSRQTILDLLDRARQCGLAVEVRKKPFVGINGREQMVDAYRVVESAPAGARRKGRK